MTAAYYILENPERAGLTGDWRDYRFLGTLVPGYPEFDPRTPDFRERFWRVHWYLAGRTRAGGRKASVASAAERCP